MRTFNKLKQTLSILVLATCMLITSCESALDVDADGVVSGDIYTSQKNFEDALISAYYNLGGIYDGIDGGELFGGDFILIATLLENRNQFQLTWENTGGPAYVDFEDKNINVTNVRVESNWRRAYEVINTVNNIITSIDVLDAGAAKDKILGEALAIRGILYFEMVRFWGPEYDATTISENVIPLILEPINDVNEIKTPTLATVGAIYTQVEQDLAQASGLLESLGRNEGFMSYYACQAYLMRAAMHKAEYGDAVTFASNIIDDVTAGSFELESTPMAAFNNSAFSKEDIFGVQQTFASNAGSIATGTGLTYFESSLAGRGDGVLRIVRSYLTNTSSFPHGPQFEDADLRGTVTLGTSEATSSDDISTAFYENVLNVGAAIPRLSSSKYMREDRVIPAVRLAEVYLSRAEAAVSETNTILDASVSDLNMIRTRAGLPALVAGDFADAAAFRDSVILERKRELLFEGVVFHDLKRWGAEINGTPATDARFILPIPQAETDTWN